jgi:arylsulfatase A-like enzyme
VVPRRSSIIFIACHGLGCGDLSCYGQTNFQTPNLDKLAAEGTRFTSYRAAGGRTAAGAGRVDDGKKCRARARRKHAGRNASSQAGYHTGLLGEWTLGAQPWTQGFDEFAGFLNDQEAKNYFADSLWRYAPNSIYDETNRTFRAYAGREQISENSGGQHGRYLPDVFLTRGGEFRPRQQPDFANHYRPFFLLLNLPAPRSATLGRADFPVPTDAPFTGEQWPQAAKNRAALLTRLDAGIGRLLEQLTKLRMTNNVAIFFTSAIGPEHFADTNLVNFLNPGGQMRDENSEARLRVPMIVRWPEHMPAGRVTNAAVERHGFCADRPGNRLCKTGTRRHRAFPFCRRCLASRTQTRPLCRTVSQP